MTTVDLRRIRPVRQPVPAWHARYHIDSRLTPPPWPHARHRKSRSPSWWSVAAALMEAYRPSLASVTAAVITSSCASVSVLAALGGWTP